MKVINTTTNLIKVSIKGHEYVLEPEATLKGVPEADAEYWVTKLHQFLRVEPEEVDVKPAIGSAVDKADKAEEKKEEKKEVTKETKK